jgi:pyrroline-5-carboxylate reductase
MRDALEGKLLISILAGVTISQLSEMVPSSTRVIRAMPNTPCRVRHYARRSIVHLTRTLE